MTNDNTKYHRQSNHVPLEVCKVLVSLGDESNDRQESLSIREDGTQSAFDVNKNDWQLAQSLRDKMNELGLFAYICHSKSRMTHGYLWRQTVHSRR